MTLESQREADNTRAKLRLLEQRYATLQSQPTSAGEERVREWTLLSLKKLINQFKEEISRFEARAGTRTG